ncbi:hypothetical protein VTK73DRAFT_1192 [Phialemonium thermophilum]|uniref:Uncharacterized protein n=1 Tax=Phialemonium thermophilum TaxID=223376 RepID=A0ABR3XAT9_9PEZI
MLPKDPFHEIHEPRDRELTSYSSKLTGNDRDELNKGQIEKKQGIGPLPVYDASRLSFIFASRLTRRLGNAKKKRLGEGGAGGDASPEEKERKIKVSVQQNNDNQKGKQTCRRKGVRKV